MRAAEESEVVAEAELLVEFESLGLLLMELDDDEAREEEEEEEEPPVTVDEDDELTVPSEADA
jgi:hypothetical protein